MNLVGSKKKFFDTFICSFFFKKKHYFEFLMFNVDTIYYIVNKNKHLILF